MTKEVMKLALQYIESNAETRDELEIAEGLRQAIAEEEKQQHTWVGLNGADWNNFNPLIANDVHRVAEWVEKILRERNT
jgi:hypothetical protein